MTGVVDGPSAPEAPVLSVVMPVYNEAGNLEESLLLWRDILRRVEPSFVLLALDDGSTDASGRILEDLKADFPELNVHHHANRGHGRTIRRGYELASGAWVLQTDSDQEVPPSALLELWQSRSVADVIIGRRSNRDVGIARNFVSRLAGWWVRRQFGGRVTDVNSPFRLMRREFLAGGLPLLPPAAFAPNVLLTGLAARDGWRVLEVPVCWQPRRLGAGFRITPRTLGILWGVARDVRTVAGRNRARGHRRD